MVKRAILSATKPAILASTLAGAAVISGAVYTVTNRASYARGIEETTAAIERVDEQLAQNIRWGDAFLMNKAAPAFAAAAAGAGGFEEIQEAITQIVRLGESQEGLRRGDYRPAVRNGIKNALAIYGRTPAPGASVAAEGLRLTDWGLRAVESYVILSERSRLIQVRDDLESALNYLKRREAGTLGDDEPAVPSDERRLTTDPQWLETLKVVSAHLATDGDQELFRKAMGSEIVQPDSMESLERVPNLNPDWVEAVQKCRRAAVNLDFGSWATCDKYPDGRFVPAFGMPGASAPSTPQRPAQSTLPGMWSVSVSAVTTDSPRVGLPTRSQSNRHTLLLFVQGPDGRAKWADIGGGRLSLSCPPDPGCTLAATGSGTYTGDWSFKNDVGSLVKGQAAFSVRSGAMRGTVTIDMRYATGGSTQVEEVFEGVPGDQVLFEAAWKSITFDDPRWRQP